MTDQTPSRWFLSFYTADREGKNDSFMSIDLQHVIGVRFVAHDEEFGMDSAVFYMAAPARNIKVRIAPATLEEISSAWVKYVAASQDGRAR